MIVKLQYVLQVSPIANKVISKQNKTILKQTSRMLEVATTQVELDASSTSIKVPEAAQKKKFSSNLKTTQPTSVRSQLKRPLLQKRKFCYTKQNSL